VARAARLGARRVDLLLSVIVVVVLIGILAQVLYSFALYLSAVAHAPEKLAGLLRFETDGMPPTSDRSEPHETSYGTVQHWCRSARPGNNALSVQS